MSDKKEKYKAIPTAGERILSGERGRAKARGQSQVRCFALSPTLEWGGIGGSSQAGWGKPHRGGGLSLFVCAHTIESTGFFEKIRYRHGVKWVSRQFSVALWHLGTQRSQQALLGRTSEPTWVY